MIYLSADIHHASLQTGNQQHCDISELATARLFLKRIEQARVKLTCFITGRCFAEEWADTQVLCNSDRVEVGGHTWSGFTPVIWHRACNKLVGSYNGPYWYQYLDTLRTIKIIEKKTGQRISCWRNHMYKHGPHTDKVLSQLGIKLCSDGVKRENDQPLLSNAGIYNFPLNIIPDHEHLYHAERTPEWVERWQKRYQWSDDFGCQSYYIQEWAEQVLNQLQTCEAQGRDANLLIHPITMYLCDQFQCFDKILDYISRRETGWLSEAVPSPLPEPN